MNLKELIERLKWFHKEIGDKGTEPHKFKGDIRFELPSDDPSDEVNLKELRVTEKELEVHLVKVPDSSQESAVLKNFIEELEVHSSKEEVSFWFDGKKLEFKEFDVGRTMGCGCWLDAIIIFKELL
jgi:hypothetical protein